ncbi:hypothetical protein BC751_1009 [Cecembia calidifontis]|uniref:Uncharacterized protein n=1 Tax=Cecembia calidifontis TaxID=1187080 RepID=A0A4Q7P5Y7_9BACT|nr:hypothetical protein BC751_1009 [Cecembia calidifontis]
MSDQGGRDTEKDLYGKNGGTKLYSQKIPLIIPVPNVE